MPDQRYLIVNADDFGQSLGVNRGVAAGFERGILTSASLMVRWPAAAEAADYARANPALGVGLHLDLGEWAFRDGRWVPKYEVVPTTDPTAVADEAARQLAMFQDLIGRNPSHLDSHQHVHRSEPVRTVVARMANQLGISVRHLSPTIAHVGDFYGQAGTGEPFPDGITVDHLLRILHRLPGGVTELSCHPGEGEDVDSMYRSERARELATLCNSRVSAAVAELGIQLISFAEVPEHGRTE